MFDLDLNDEQAFEDVVRLHRQYYVGEWGFRQSFENKVRSELSEFLARINPSQDLFLNAYQDGRFAGSITLDGVDAGTHGAHLRWFIVGSEFRGKGLGKRLIDQALVFCRARKFYKVYLDTFSGLDIAAHLYRQFGFVLESEADVDQWGGSVHEQRHVLNL